MGRKWISTIGILLVYVLVSGLILGFAQGYTIDFQTQQLVTTGVLELSTFPVQATVSIDNVALKEKTPVSLSHYMPGTYALHVELPGYQSIDLSTVVASHVVTRLRELPFWPEANNWQSKVVAEEPVVAVRSLNQNGMFMIQTAKEITWWRATGTDLQKALVIPITEKEFVLCSENGEACVIGGDERTILVDILDVTYRVLKGTILPKDDMHFFRFQNNYFILSRHNAALNLERISNEEGSVTNELEIQNVAAFDLLGQDIWFMQNNTLYRKSLISGLQQVITVMDIPVDNVGITTEYVLLHTLDGQVVLWQRANEALTLVNKWASARFFVSNNRIMIVSEAKVWVIDSDEGLQFVGQASSEITFAQVYSSYSWLANTADGKVQMIMSSPLGIYTVDVDTNQIAVLPYQTLLKWKDNMVQYHFYPIRTWLKALTS